MSTSVLLWNAKENKAIISLRNQKLNVPALGFYNPSIDAC